MRRTLLLVAALGLAALSFGQAELRPGDHIAVPQVNLDGLTDLVAFKYTDFTGHDDEGNSTFLGGLVSYVFRQSDGNLAFYYSFANDTSSTEAIDRMTLLNYGDTATSVCESVVAPGVPFLPATTATRSTNGHVIGFNFDGIEPGSSTDNLFIVTDAKEWGDGSAQFIGGGVATASTLVPSFGSSVPEPAAFAALGVGVFGLMRRRRRN